MKNVIIGTAGHIDHGKTTLIKALTGRDTDNLKQEKDRGISIELGFTYFDLPSGRRAGIIDVPGHEKFIKNMLAGVSGMDVVILVVAADEGMMPQTIEHLNILNLLNIKKGIIALTKTDTVDNEWIELVKEDIYESVENTFLKDAKIIEVSSTKLEGIDELSRQIDYLTSEIENRDSKNIPRLPIDRVFTLTGFGTIITGTLLQGSLKVSDEVEIYPKGLKARIRSVQVHGEDTDIALAGQRVAINLVGVKKSEIEKGNIISYPDSMVNTRMIDVKLNLLENSPWIIENRTRLRLYLGTEEILCRAILLDKENLTPGESGYVQLRLENITSSKIGDRFIVRFYSPMTTVGGGIVLDNNPTKKKRFKSDIIKELKARETGNKEKILEESIKEKSRSFPSTKDLSIELVTTESEIKNNTNKLTQNQKIIKFTMSDGEHYIHIDYFEYIKMEIIEFLQKYHEKNSLKKGILKEEIKSKYFSNIKPKLSELFIDKLIYDNIIKQDNLYISLNNFQIKYNEKEKSIKDNIYDLILKDKFNPPKINELIKILQHKEEEVLKVIDSCIQQEGIILLDEDIIISKQAYDNSLDIIRDYLNKNSSISLGEFRDLLNTSRKFAMALLEDFDRNKFTKRIEDKRIIY
ncbi:selenocysteine-specific translation elongation factor [Senegalia massiliensis]|uniref:Selenocysteine-specific elongation factor n=1 Tax=Senegalia massiliensis TaxID=1720316 RepID=A0A845QT39_9CLOT|nr:selenocysteine-specific translation elongation factor [Senegalia massiliensis]NBI05705.1 selenocysteine-specific translation elongation factor [Senegalia massiliensis]